MEKESPCKHQIQCGLAQLIYKVDFMTTDISKDTDMS